MAAALAQFVGQLLRLVQYRMPHARLPGGVVVLPIAPQRQHVSRPAIAEKRLSLTHHGKVRCELKTPYRDGTTHVIFEPVDFTAPAHPCTRGISASVHVIAKLAALVPRPRVNRTRFHGVFAPNSKHRVWVTPARRGRAAQKWQRIRMRKYLRKLTLR